MVINDSPRAWAEAFDKCKQHTTFDPTGPDTYMYTQWYSNHLVLLNYAKMWVVLSIKCENHEMHA